jgi:hypothetical protein
MRCKAFIEHNMQLIQDQPQQATPADSGSALTLLIDYIGFIGNQCKLCYNGIKWHYYVDEKGHD